MPKVSAIVIFFNAEKFMDETIQSVLAQTFEDWELLLVDDGSTDSSTALAQKYAALYSQKIRYVEHPGHKNHGMSATRNLGLRQARGEYIAYLDADDVWLPQKLEKQSEILDKNPMVGGVYGATSYWYGWTGNPEDIKRDHLGQLGVTADLIIDPPELMTLYLTSKGACVPCMCAIMMRKSTLDRMNGFEENFKGMYEDQVFYAKMALNHRIYIQSGTWDKYRQHADSACAQAEKRGDYIPGQPHRSELIYLNWLTDYIARKEIKDPNLKKALRDKMFPYQHPVLSRLKEWWKTRFKFEV